MISRLSWCWFGLTLALALGLVGLNACVRGRAYDQVTAVATGSAPAGDPGAGRHRIIPPTANDSLYWIAYAQRVAATGGWRLRTTDLDNAPRGREIHWSSGLTWWLVACGGLRHLATGEPMSQAIEYAAACANPALLALALGALAVATAARFGPAAGGLAVVAAVSAPQLFSSFGANEPDHHGLINVAALGTLFGLVAGGFGWERTAAGPARGLLPGAGTARRWFIASAWCGAVGLWLSAASQILVFLGLGLAAVVASWPAGRSGADEVARPDLWRTWGRWGAGLTLGFYLLEYFPGHLALRLEVNHPLHAAAWWGAGEWLAALAAWRQGTGRLWPAGARDRAWRALAGAALAAPPAAIAIGGVAWFRMLDPIFSVLPSLVVEGQSLLDNVRAAGLTAAARDLAALALLLAAGLSALGAPGLTRAGRAVVLAVLAAHGPLLAAMWLQNRWTMLVAAMAPLLAVVSIAAWRSTWPRWRTGAVVVLLAGAVAAIFPVRVVRLAQRIAAMKAISLGRDDAFVVTVRHYAQELRRLGAATSAPPIVLAGPNESALLAYYGGLRTVGTLYWENLDGLKAAAAIYATPDLAEAKRLLAARGVTYLFSFPPGNFAFGYAAIATGALDQRRAGQSFAALVFTSGRFPVWLRPIWLPPPRTLAGLPPAQCYQFVPDQTEAEQQFHLQRYHQQAALHAARQP